MISTITIYAIFMAISVYDTRSFLETFSGKSTETMLLYK